MSVPLTIYNVLKQSTTPSSPQKQCEAGLNKASCRVSTRSLQIISALSSLAAASLCYIKCPRSTVMGVLLGGVAVSQFSSKRRFSETEAELRFRLATNLSYTTTLAAYAAVVLQPETFEPYFPFSSQVPRCCTAYRDNSSLFSIPALVGFKTVLDVVRPIFEDLCF